MSSQPHIPHRFFNLRNLAYFNQESLKNILEILGYECIEWYGDSFIDFNLMNPLTDYYKIENIGKVCYKAMLDIEDIMEDIQFHQQFYFSELADSTMTKIILMHSPYQSSQRNVSL